MPCISFRTWSDVLWCVSDSTAALSTAMGEAGSDTHTGRQKSAARSRPRLSGSRARREEDRQAERDLRGVAALRTAETEDIDAFSEASDCLLEIAEALVDRSAVERCECLQKLPRRGGRHLERSLRRRRRLRLVALSWSCSRLTCDEGLSGEQRQGASQSSSLQQGQREQRHSRGV